MAIRRSPDSRQSSPTVSSAKKRAPARTPSTNRSLSAAAAPKIAVSEEVRRQMIAEAAYLNARSMRFSSRITATRRSRKRRGNYSVRSP